MQLSSKLLSLFSWEGGFTCKIFSPISGEVVYEYIGHGFSCGTRLLLGSLTTGGLSYSSEDLPLRSDEDTDLGLKIFSGNLEKTIDWVFA